LTSADDTTATTTTSSVNDSTSASAKIVASGGDIFCSDVRRTTIEETGSWSTTQMVSTWSPS
jgi:hypothetical protein